MTPEGQTTMDEQNCGQKITMGCIEYAEYNRMYIKPTKLGQWLNKRTWEDLLDWTAVIPGCVLEIGPGRGYVGDFCKEYGMDYTCIEATKNLHNSMIERGFNSYNSFVPPLPDEVKNGKKFDIAVAMAVLEHMPTHKEALQLVTEIKETLNPGGSIVLHVPEFNGKDFYRNTFDHSYPCTRERLYGLLKAAGYINIRTEYACFVFRGIIARLWSCLHWLFPFEFIKELFPNNKYAIRFQKIRSIFALCIYAKGQRIGRT